MRGERTIMSFVTEINTITIDHGGPYESYLI